MSNDVFLFYTYDSVGKDVVIPITAKDRETAFELFDQRYGTDTMIDFVVKKQQQYPAN